MAKVIYISGGQRSGKSSFAQRTAEGLSDNPIYLATAKCWDEEFKQRIERHQSDRGDNWRTLEEPMAISTHELSGSVVLMDCVTLWLTNIFMEFDMDAARSLAWAKEEWMRFTAQDFTLIVVSNEIGMGVVAIEPSTRAFVDMQGWMNQFIAQGADQAYAMISGLPLKLK
ncbi:MAG: bifunctional adenosylcobinamide kinase/adenosylcobinamide-phosphate guanylyltransferase [Rikenellaceae bacterium]